MEKAGVKRPVGNAKMKNCKDCDRWFNGDDCFDRHEKPEHMCRRRKSWFRFAMQFVYANFVLDVLQIKNINVITWHVKIVVKLNLLIIFVT